MDELSVQSGPGPTPLATIPGSASAVAADAEGVLQLATSYQVGTREQFQEAMELLRRVKGLWNRLEAERVKVTGPLNAALKTVNDWFRTPLDKLRRAEAHLKDVSGGFEARERARVQEEERQARLRADAEREELERRAASASARGNTVKAEELRTRAAATVAKPAETAPLKARGASFGEHWTYTVTDEAAVPREYLMVDHAKIRGVVTALKGATRIPGVSVQMKPQVGVRGTP